jgi:excisionase family DNA binding protein
MQMSPLAYTVDEACNVAKVGKTSLYEAINNGDLPAKKRGRRTLILSADLRGWIERLPGIKPKNATPPEVAIGSRCPDESVPGCDRGQGTSGNPEGSAAAELDAQLTTPRLGPPI